MLIDNHTGRLFSSERSERRAGDGVLSTGTGTHQSLVHVVDVASELDHVLLTVGHEPILVRGPGVTWISHE